MHVALPFPTLASNSGRHPRNLGTRGYQDHGGTRRQNPGTFFHVSAEGRPPIPIPPGFHPNYLAQYREARELEYLKNLFKHGNSRFVSSNEYVTLFKDGYFSWRVPSLSSAQITKIIIQMIMFDDVVTFRGFQDFMWCSIRQQSTQYACENSVNLSILHLSHALIPRDLLITITISTSRQI